jgi:hypothetical protein
MCYSLVRICAPRPALLPTRLYRMTATMRGNRERAALLRWQNIFIFIIFIIT